MRISVTEFGGLHKKKLTAFYKTKKEIRVITEFTNNFVSKDKDCRGYCCSFSIQTVLPQFCPSLNIRANISFSCWGCQKEIQ